MQSNSRHIQLSQYGLGGGSKPGCLDPNYHFLRLQPSIWGGCQSCWPMPGRKFLRSQALNSTPLRAQQSTWQMFSPEFLPWSVLVTSSVLQMILKSFPCSFFWRFILQIDTSVSPIFFSIASHQSLGSPAWESAWSLGRVPSIHHRIRKTIGWNIPPKYTHYLSAKILCQFFETITPTDSYWSW